MDKIRDIVMYGNAGCSDCRRSKQLLELHKVSFTYRDVEADPDADKEFRELIGNDNRSLPRLLFRSGADTAHMSIDETLIEPSNDKLLRELRIHHWIIS